MGYLRRVPWGYGGAKAFRLCQTRVGKQTNLVFQMTLHPGRRDATFWVSWPEEIRIRPRRPGELKLSYLQEESRLRHAQDHIRTKISTPKKIFYVTWTDGPSSLIIINPNRHLHDLSDRLIRHTMHEQSWTEMGLDGLVSWCCAVYVS